MARKAATTATTTQIRQFEPGRASGRGMYQSGSRLGWPPEVVVDGHGVVGRCRIRVGGEGQGDELAVAHRLPRLVLAGAVHRSGNAALNSVI